MNKAWSADETDGPTMKIKPHRGSSLDTSLANEVDSPTTPSAPNDDTTSSTVRMENSLAKQRRADFTRANTLPI